MLILENGSNQIFFFGGGGGGGQRGLVVKRPPGNQEVGVRTPLQPCREKTKIGHWDSPLHNVPQLFSRT